MTRAIIVGIYLITSLVSILMTLGVPIAGAVGTWLLMRRWAAASRLCEACGLPVRGPEGLDCPGCGASYLVVGIKARNMPVQRLTALLVVAWFIFGLIMAGATFDHIRQSLPFVLEFNPVLTLSAPESGAYQAVSVGVDVRYRSGWRDGPAGATHRRWTAEFHDDAGQPAARVMVDEIEQSCVLDHTSVVSHHTGRINKKILGDWLASVFPEVRENSLLYAEADDIIEHADQWLNVDADEFIRASRSGRSISWGHGRSRRPAFAGMDTNVNYGFVGREYVQPARMSCMFAWWLPAVVIVAIGRHILLRQIAASERRADALVN